MKPSDRRFIKKKVRELQRAYAFRSHRLHKLSADIAQRNAKDPISWEQSYSLHLAAKRLDDIAVKIGIATKILDGEIAFELVHLKEYFWSV